MSGHSPPTLKSSTRSKNWPWMSPQMVTGASTRCTFDSSTRISRALAHSALTSLSLSVSQRFSCAICRSRSLVLPRPPPPPEDVKAAEEADGPAPAPMPPPPPPPPLTPLELLDADDDIAAARRGGRCSKSRPAPEAATGRFSDRAQKTRRDAATRLTSVAHERIKSAGVQVGLRMRGSFFGCDPPQNTPINLVTAARRRPRGSRRRCPAARRLARLGDVPLPGLARVEPGLPAARGA